jgi:DNA polymerase-1
MQRNVLIDGNNQAHIHNNVGKLNVGALETQAIFGMIKSLRTIKEFYKDEGKLLMLWDGRAQWRYDMLPTYKDKRNSDPKSANKRVKLNEQRPYIERAISLLGVTQMTGAKQEADDMAGYFVCSSKDAFDLITGDMDWLQLVRANVSWYDPVKKQRITIHNFMDSTGFFTPREFLQGKCLQGDTSDKIPGVGGIGEKTTPVFMAEHKNVASFFNKVESGLYVPKGKKLKEFATPEGKRKFAKNWKLMNLTNVPKPDPKDVKIVRSEFDEGGFIKLCEELAFKSILNKMDEFIRPFKEQNG